MALPHVTDFDILDKLGVGSYAIVYKARQKASINENHISFTTKTRSFSLITTIFYDIEK